MASPAEPSSLDHLLDHQARVLTRAQAAKHGLSDGTLAAHIAARRWQRVHRGIYAVTTGSLTVEAERWAAVLACGPGAVLSHATAAAMHGLRIGTDDRIHVTVPEERRIAAPAGVRLHRGRRLAARTHPHVEPARTTVEATVIDLVHAAATSDRALAVVAQACQQRLTTAGRLRRELSMRGTAHRRREVMAALGDIDDGAHSLLELRYLRDVERRHGLPQGHRQRAVRRGRRREWTDVSYDDYATVVELDGRLGHSDAVEVWRDMRRDNAAVVAGEASLRYGWADVHRRPCSVAAQVAGVLRTRGWVGEPRKCGGSCEL